MKKKICILINSFLMMVMLLMLTSNCKKGDSSNTNNSGNITDVEGNVYNTVTIGTQIWTAENIKTTKYKDGTLIPNVTDDPTWSSLTSGAYSWYNNEVNNKNKYGALYNWYTVNTGKLCPSGWHVPTNSEWAILITYLGGESVAGGNMKETGTTHWLSPNTMATNNRGFSGLPGGTRGHDNVNGSFCNDEGQFGGFWSSSEWDPSHGWILFLHYNSGSAGNDGGFKQMGHSVRCVRD